MRQRGMEELVVGLYVDDLIITSARTEDINRLKARWRLVFE